MNRRAVLTIAASCVMGLTLFAGSASTQQPSDIEAIKAAHQAFYTALSAKDAKAMEAVWANKPYVTNIGPTAETIAVGYANAVTEYWPATFDLFSQIDVSPLSIAHIQVGEKLASVVGTESVVLLRKGGGEPLEFEALVTNVFEEDGDRWLMISHQAQTVKK
ncbi:MAG: nuclear transport factor 2 family protein [Alphaproteobacteria bacterium]|nr:nuclear transport factor 2 family protein [Alphaproteobacteria bacterium]